MQISGWDDSKCPPLHSGHIQRKDYFAFGATAFAERSVAMKAPVGLLSGRAVCVSRWRGFAPTSSAGFSESRIKNLIPLFMRRVQRRRPPPVAETGRSCWGSGQQDASAVQGTMRMLGAATRKKRSAFKSFFRTPPRRPDAPAGHTAMPRRTG